MIDNRVAIGYRTLQGDRMNKKPYKPSGIAALVMRNLARATEPLSAYAIGVRLERSGGAVKNACDKLVAEGFLKRVGHCYTKKAA